MGLDYRAIAGRNGPLVVWLKRKQAIPSYSPLRLS